jgi:CRP-like cAMP-binding protein
MSRVATRLVELAERFGVPDRQGGVEIRLPITQDELAGWAGCSREAVGKALQAPAGQGLGAYRPPLDRGRRPRGPAITRPGLTPSA